MHIYASPPGPSIDPVHINFASAMPPPAKPFLPLFSLVLLPLLFSPSAATTLAFSPSFYSSLRSALIMVQNVTSLLSAASVGPAPPPGPRRLLSFAMKDCLELLDATTDEISWALSVAENRPLRDAPTTGNPRFDVQTWLGAALGNQDTCKESFREANASTVYSPDPAAAFRLDDVTSLIASALHEVATQARAPASSPPKGRKLMGFFPEWVPARERRLLKESPVVPKVVPDVVVALDGSGNYTSILEAVESAPPQKMARFVIYVKAGLYLENVEVRKKFWNVMLIGDGMNRTIISGNRSVASGWTTYRSATLAARGRGFVAWNLRIENTAGPQGDQAVALRACGDLGVYFRCSISGYQDTLYAYSLRHFYRSCHITGTVDFIFGQATAIFQSSFILPRLAHKGHMNTITAQARRNLDQENGFCFQFCNVTAAADLAEHSDGINTYLGRPWRPFSRVIFMQSYIGSVVRPEGWLEWDDRKEGLDTLYYGEYANTGPGSAVDRRVSWAGYHVITEPAIASEFTVTEFLEGEYWLPGTGVHYIAGLDT